MRIAVVGASGFVGRALLPNLRSSGHEVIAMGRSDGDRTLDVTHPGAVRAAVDAAEPELLVNLATARTGDESHLQAVNVDGPRLLAEACAATGVRRMVHVTSATEYGAAPAPLREDGPRVPQTTYGCSRFAGTEAARAVARRTSLELVVVPLFLPYGVGMPAGSLLPEAVRCARSGDVLPLTPLGATRDLLHVDDVARGLLAAAAVDLAESTIVNLCSGVAIDNHELVDVVEEVVGRPVRRAVGAMPLRPWDRDDWRGDRSRAAQVLGWEPSIGLADGVARCIDAWAAA